MLEEVLEQIRETEKRVVELDHKYAAEENEREAEILWHKKERAEVKLDNLINKADKIRDGGIEDEEDKKEEDKATNNNEHQGDTDVCPDCGSDLEETNDEGLYRCVKCGEYFEIEEKEEEEEE